jgi:hypothetical protein
MCNNSACCPSAQIFQENICGNITGPLNGVAATVWAVDPIGVSDYFQGTIEVFNSSNTPFDVIITRAGAADVAFAVPPLTTISRSVLNPTSLVTTLDIGETGKYCIILYKRVF